MESWRLFNYNRKEEIEDMSKTNKIFPIFSIAALILSVASLTVSIVSTTRTTTKATKNEDMLDYVSLCVATQFHLDHSYSEILTIDTKQSSDYYLSDICYRIDFINNIYNTSYISAVNDKNELVVKEITKK